MLDLSYFSLNCAIGHPILFGRMLIPYRYEITNKKIGKCITELLTHYTVKNKINCTVKEN